MHTNKVSEWTKKLDDTFHGEMGIVGEQLLHIERAENEIAKLLVTQFSFFSRVMDSLLSFYLETLQTIVQRQPSVRSHLTEIKAVVHRSSFHRFKSADSLFMRGYFSSALGLLRAILENALQMTALQRNIITWEDIIGKLDPEKAQTLPYDEAAKLVEKHTKDVDRKVNTFICGKESGLSPATRRSIKGFKDILNYATHKSRLDIFNYFLPLVTGKQGLTLEPSLDPKMAIMYVNYSQFIGWMILRTFPLIQAHDNEFSQDWFRKYFLLDEYFNDFTVAYPVQLGRAVEELIEKKFNFGFMPQSINDVPSS